MTDAEIADRLLEMREATARKCVEIAETVAICDPFYEHKDECHELIASAIKKEFGLEG